MALSSPGRLSVREVAELLEQETLQVLKKECGGLQTLLKNNHQVFRGTCSTNPASTHSTAPFPYIVHYVWTRTQRVRVGMFGMLPKMYIQ